MAAPPTVWAVKALVEFFPTSFWRSTKCDVIWPTVIELWPIYFKPRPLRGHLSACGRFEKRLHNIYGLCVKFLVWGSFPETDFNSDAWNEITERRLITVKCVTMNKHRTAVWLAGRVGSDFSPTRMFTSTIYTSWTNQWQLSMSLS